MTEVQIDPHPAPSQGTSSTPGYSQEQLEVELPTTTDDNITYPTGLKLWMSVTAVLLSTMLVGLDMTIVAVTVPSITNQFKTVEDIGWYSAAYSVVFSSFTFFFSKLYTLFSVKRLFLISTCIFELGSLVCMLAPTSAAFIAGRALAGLGNSGINMGVFLIITYSFPVHKRPLWTGVSGATQFSAMVFAPLIGGVLVDAISWRACFGINLPLGVIVICMTAYGFHSPVNNPDIQLPFREKLDKMDLSGTFFFMPGMVSFLIALQWGGIKYGWANPRIIVLCVLFAILLGIFGYIQYRKQEQATLPVRILKQRSVLAGAWFSACCNGCVAVLEYYISIYFQGVEGFSATKSGILCLPLIGGLCVAAPLAGALITKVGYYYPFMLATSALTPIATGLLTTLSLNDNLVKVLCLLGFLGVGVGLGIQGPVMAVQTVLPIKDVSIGTAITGFGGGLGSSLFISASATLFQNRLAAELAKYAPGTNATSLNSEGLASIRNSIGADRLRDLLLGYDKAVMQTLYMPVALATLSIIGSVAMERRSVKKKQS